MRGFCQLIDHVSKSSRPAQGAQSVPVADTGGSRGADFNLLSAFTTMIFIKFAGRNWTSSSVERPFLQNCGCDSSTTQSLISGIEECCEMF